MPTMRTAFKYALFLVLIAIAGCAPIGPPFASVTATLPPVPQGMARIFFYRSLEIYETTAPVQAYLNGNPAGVTETGAVYYRDVAPGRYTVSVQSYGIYPDQFKTVSLNPGDVAYARIESLRSWTPCGGGGGGDSGGGAGGGNSGCWDTFVVVFTAPATAQAEMQSLRFIAG
jgi:hypothetical protein